MTRRVKAGLVLIVVSFGGSVLLGIERPPKTVVPIPRRVVRPATPTSGVFLQALRNLWERSGSYIDPFGNPSQNTSSSGASTSTTDGGSYIDPFGGH